MAITDHPDVQRLIKQVVQLQAKNKELVETIKFISSVLGEGGRRGRPMDLIDNKSWEKWRELKKQALVEAEEEG